MPATDRITLPSGDTLRVWNVEQRVGGDGSPVGLDVKLVQYLLAWFGDKKTTVSRLHFTDVDGVWGPKSRAALSAFEATEGSLVWGDGAVDSMKPGSAIGSIHHRVYKIMTLQMIYVKKRFAKDPHDFATADLEALLMRMPEDNTNMPADLRLRMAIVRDAGG